MTGEAPSGSLLPARFVLEAWHAYLRAFPPPPALGVCFEPDPEEDFNRFALELCTQLAARGLSYPVPKAQRCPEQDRYWLVLEEAGRPPLRLETDRTGRLRAVWVGEWKRGLRLRLDEPRKVRILGRARGDIHYASLVQRSYGPLLRGLGFPHGGLRQILEEGADWRGGFRKGSSFWVPLGEGFWLVYEARRGELAVRREGSPEEMARLLASPPFAKRLPPLPVSHILQGIAQHGFSLEEGREVLASLRAFSDLLALAWAQVARLLPGGIVHSAFLPDGRKLAVGQGRALLAGERLLPFPPLPSPEDPALAMATWWDGRALALGALFWEPLDWTPAPLVLEAGTLFFTPEWAALETKKKGET